MPIFYIQHIKKEYINHRMDWVAVGKDFKVDYS